MLFPHYPSGDAGGLGERTWPPLILLSWGTCPSPIGGCEKALWCSTNTAPSPLPVLSIHTERSRLLRGQAGGEEALWRANNDLLPLRDHFFVGSHPPSPPPSTHSQNLKVEMEAF